MCLHRMQGHASYIRDWGFLKDNRRISVHFTIGMDGSLEQHVDTEFAGWSQGITHDEYPDVTWPLFRIPHTANPNDLMIGIEMEDGGQPWTSARPMADDQQDTLILLLVVLFYRGIVAGDVERGHTVAGHFQIDPAHRSGPGEWWWDHQLPTILSEVRAGLESRRRVQRKPMAAKSTPDV